jgi:hypothetical protein
MKIAGIEDLQRDDGWRTFSFLKITTDGGLTAMIHGMAEALTGQTPDHPLGPWVGGMRERTHRPLVQQAAWFTSAVRRRRTRPSPTKAEPNNTAVIGSGAAVTTLTVPVVETKVAPTGDWLKMKLPKTAVVLAALNVSVKSDDAKFMPPEPPADPPICMVPPRK